MATPAPSSEAIGYESYVARFYVSYGRLYPRSKHSFMSMFMKEIPPKNGIVNFNTWTPA